MRLLTRTDTHGHARTHTHTHTYTHIHTHTYTHTHTHSFTHTHSCLIATGIGARASIGNFGTGSPDVSNAALINAFNPAIDAAIEHKVLLVLSLCCMSAQPLTRLRSRLCCWLLFFSFVWLFCIFFFSLCPLLYPPLPSSFSLALAGHSRTARVQFPCSGQLL